MKKVLIALFCGAVSMSAVAGGNIAKGQALAAKQNCAACHGADYNKPIDPSYPKLAGQHEKYLEHALRTYQRGNGPAGRNNAIMMGQVKGLTSTDLADLAAYLNSLPGELVLKR